MFWYILGAVALFIVFSIWNRGAKRHSAVMNAFLAKFTYDSLTELQQKQLDEHVLVYLAWIGLDYKAFDEISDILKFSIMASSFEELEIQPALSGEFWSYVKNPLKSLIGSDYAIKITLNHFKNTHNIIVDLEIPKRMDTYHLLGSDKRLNKIINS